MGNIRVWGDDRAAIESSQSAAGWRRRYDSMLPESRAHTTYYAFNKACSAPARRDTMSHKSSTLLLALNGGVENLRRLHPPRIGGVTSF
jgi:hypothetical protein